MILKSKTIIIASVSLLLGIAFLSCTDTTLPGTNELDYELKEAIKASADFASGTPDISFYILPDENDLAAIPQDLDGNPLNEAKVELGKFLFYDTGIAVDALKESGVGTYSCATCHIPKAGFRPWSEWRVKT